MIGKFLSARPKIAKTSFIAPGSRIIGAVEIGEYSSIWFNVVCRADIAKIKLGDYTNVQDGSVLHVADEMDVDIADYVTVGHNAVIHACRIKAGSLIGMGAVILNAADIGQGSRVAAGSLVAEGFNVPANTLAMGIPAKLIRKLTKEEKEENLYWAKKYSNLCQEYKKRKSYEQKKDTNN